MRIAILGWGSLIWDKRDLPRIEADWSKGGPKLPLEFSRISKSRSGSLTLVIDPKKGVNLPTRFAVSSRDNLDDAICDLRRREDTTVRKIGYVDVTTGLQRCSVFPQASNIIRQWAADNKFDAVIWTDLPSNFHRKTRKEFSVSNAIEYLISKLSDSAASIAREYISKAPNEIQTPLRRKLASHPWFTNPAAR